VAFSRRAGCAYSAVRNATKPFSNPHCGSEDLGWIDCAGTGEVYALTIVSRKPDHGGNYGVALIDLDEGARVMARPRDLEGLKIGDRVTIEVEEHPGGGHWLRTVRVGDAQ
jgi:uncharacterized OB-fold protein